MRCYLLGTLNAEEMISLDSRCLADQECRLAFWEAEAHLIEDYVRGRLSPSDKAAFQLHYMSTVRNQEHVALITAMMAKQKIERPALLSTRTTWLAAAALAVFLSGGAFALLREMRSQTAGLAGGAKPLPSQNVTPADPHFQGADTKLLAYERNKLAVMSLGDTARGDNGAAPASLAIPDGATEVTLVVPRDLALLEPKKATLFVEGATSRTAIDSPTVYVPPHSAFALAYVPSEILRPGSYQIQMEGQRSIAFKILRK